MWNLLKQGMEPMPLELADGFLITGPPGTSKLSLILSSFFLVCRRYDERSWAGTQAFTTGSREDSRACFPCPAEVTGAARKQGPAVQWLPEVPDLQHQEAGSNNVADVQQI